jgi:hypothetical protein
VPQQPPTTVRFRSRAQLADDPHKAPARILAGQPQNKPAHLAVDRRPGRTPMRIPAAFLEPFVSVAAASRPRLVDTANFLLATRDSGYRTTAYAVAEFVDNSLQAGATC